MESQYRTVEPRYNEVPRDRENVFVITGVRYIWFCSIHFTVTLIGRVKNIVRYNPSKLFLARDWSKHVT